MAAAATTFVTMVCYNPNDIRELPAATVQHVHLVGRGFRSLEPLRRLRVMRKLDLAHCDRVSDLSPLSDCEALQEVRVSHAAGVSDYSPLARCPSLRKLVFVDRRLDDDEVRTALLRTLSQGSSTRLRQVVINRRRYKRRRGGVESLHLAS